MDTVLPSPSIYLHHFFAETSFCVLLKNLYFPVFPHFAAQGPGKILTSSPVCNRFYDSFQIISTACSFVFRSAQTAFVPYACAQAFCFQHTFKAWNTSAPILMDSRNRGHCGEHHEFLEINGIIACAPPLMTFHTKAQAQVSIAAAQYWYRGMFRPCAPAGKSHGDTQMALAPNLALLTVPSSLSKVIQIPLVSKTPAFQALQ
jgi:hypothetical protein